MIISLFLRQFKDIQAVQYAFWGIRAGVLALIVKALWSMYVKCPKNPVAYFIAAFAFVAAAIFDVNVLVVIVSCALFGVVSSLIASKKMKAVKGGEKE